MKKVCVIAAVALLAGMVQADFFVSFSSSFGTYNLAGDAGLIGGVGDTATLELLYVGANGIIDYESGTDILAGGSGDDELLTTFTVANTGGSYEDYGFFAPVVIDTVSPITGAASGDIYGRIWWTQDPAVGGAWYYQGNLFSASNLDSGADPAPLPQGYDINGQVGFGQVIPEPATIGLMGIAGLGMYLARRKVRR